MFHRKIYKYQKDEVMLAVQTVPFTISTDKVSVYIVKGTVCAASITLLIGLVI